MIDEINLDSTGSLSWIDPGSWTPLPEPSPPAPADNISTELKKYFFHKIEKKGIHGAEKVFDQYLKAGFSQKAAIALTDRKFFPTPHTAGHGNYLKNVLGDEFFQKEQVARKEGGGKSKKHEYTKQMHTGGGHAGQYILGMGEMALGAGLMVVGAGIEIGSLGTLTIAVAFEEMAAAALVADGFARTMNNRDISFDKNISPATWKSTDVQLPEISGGTKPPYNGEELGDNPAKPPGKGFEWKGNDTPGSKEGSWYNSGTHESLHPDLKHPAPYKPHWDYKGPNGEKARLNTDGTWEWK